MQYATLNNSIYPNGKMPPQVIRNRNFNKTIGSGTHLTKFRMRNSRGQYQSIDVGSGSPPQMSQRLKMPSIGFSARGATTADTNTSRTRQRPPPSEVARAENRLRRIEKIS